MRKSVEKPRPDRQRGRVFSSTGSLKPACLLDTIVTALQTIFTWQLKEILEHASRCPTKMAEHIVRLLLDDRRMLQFSQEGEAYKTW